MEYRFAESNGGRIYYHERGKGEPLVLIMGFGASGVVWNKHTAVYEKHFRCIILDNRGVGQSDQSEGPYTTAMMAADTIAVMNHAGVQRAHVAGISMGGAITQELAIRYPERVNKLLLVSSWARFNNYAKAVYVNLKHIRASVSTQHYMELLQLWIFAPPHYEKSWDELKQGAADAANDPLLQSQLGFEGQLDACINHNSVDRLHLIKSPTLITVGMKDIFTPPEFSYQIHEHIKGSNISEYPDGGHVHHWEDLNRFNNETLQFLKN
jgi:pimeloyl-ACP methyl ester carboxylesterase